MNDNITVMNECPRCKGSIKKAGEKVRAGEKRQMYICNDCGYNFWEGQEPRSQESNPPCPKCQALTQKYGTGFKAGQKLRKYRCGSCGHVFLGDGPVEE